jgi:hypothetical protein
LRRVLTAGVQDIDFAVLARRVARGDAGAVLLKTVLKPGDLVPEAGVTIYVDRGSALRLTGGAAWATPLAKTAAARNIGFM